MFITMTEAEAHELMDKACLLEEVEDALLAPNGVSSTTWASRCADAHEALLEAAGLVPEETSAVDEQTREKLAELLSVEDLVALSRGEDLPIDHPFITWVRDGAA